MSCNTDGINAAIAYSSLVVFELIFRFHLSIINYVYKHIKLLQKRLALSRMSSPPYNSFHCGG